MPTRLSQYPRLAAEWGGQSGAITSGGATSAVLAGLVGSTLDDSKIDAVLAMPDAANVGDRDRVISDWAGATGTATWVGSRADTTYSGETWFTVPSDLRWNLADIHLAQNETLRETRFGIQSVLPTIEGRSAYALTAFDWITETDLVTRVTFRGSLCLLDNEAFDLWHNNPGAAGLSANPTGWTISGSNAEVFRTATNFGFGPYAASLLRSGTDAVLDNTFGALDGQLPGQVVSASLTCVSAQSNSLRVGLNDGATTTWSDYHTGGGDLETLTVSKTFATTASTGIARISLEQNETATIHRCLVEEASSINDALQTYGSQHFREETADYQMRTVGGVVTMVVRPQNRGGQYLISSTAPYAEVTTDAAVSDIPADVWERGTLYHLFAKTKPHQERTRHDREMARHGMVYARLAPRLLDDPAPDAQPRVVTRGA